MYHGCTNDKSKNQIHMCSGMVMACSVYTFIYQYPPLSDIKLLTSRQAYAVLVPYTAVADSYSL